MADFCAHCSPDIWEGCAPAAELMRRNDFAGWLGPGATYGARAWGLCENCGSHLFDNGGRRACGGAGQPQALYNSCERCLVIVASRPPLPAQGG
jgi:hypothetical protein